jgi:hypothetical protein
MINPDRIIEVAKLMLQVDQMEQNGSPTKELNVMAERLKHELNQLTPREMIFLPMVRNVLEGKPFAFSTDNPETLKDARDLTERLGVSFPPVEESNGLFKFVIDPGRRR